MLKRIEKHSSERRATEALRHEILSGHITPGSRLVEAELADALGLSRGTVRAAFKDLAADGLIVPAATRGYKVASLTAHDVWEIYTLRNAYESMAARIVATTITKEKAEAIRAAFDALKAVVESRDKAIIFEHDGKLHGTILALTEHTRLQESYRILSRQIRFFYVLCSEFMTFDDYVSSHVDLVDAIIAGDALRAAAIAADHNTADGQAVVEKLQAQEEAAAQAARSGAILLRRDRR